MCLRKTAVAKLKTKNDRKFEKSKNEKERNFKMKAWIHTTTARNYFKFDFIHIWAVSSTFLETSCCHVTVKCTQNIKQHSRLLIQCKTRQAESQDQAPWKSSPSATRPRGARCCTGPSTGERELRTMCYTATWCTGDVWQETHPIQFEYLVCRSVTTVTETPAVLTRTVKCINAWQML